MGMVWYGYGMVVWYGMGFSTDGYMWITRGSTVAAWCVVHFQVQVKKLVLLLATSHASRLFSNLCKHFCRFEKKLLDFLILNINDVFFMLRNDCPEKVLFRQKFEGEPFFFLHSIQITVHARHCQCTTASVKA